MQNGYFIAPSGDIIPVDKSHIDMVIDNPEKFRLTKDEILEAFQKHHEKLRQEGKAREEIMTDLLKQGWIRVRYVPSHDAFTVQLNRLDARKKDHLADFAGLAMKGIKGDKFSPNSELKIVDLHGNLLNNQSLNTVAQDVLHKEARIKLIEDYIPSKQSTLSKIALLLTKLIDKLN